MAAPQVYQGEQVMLPATIMRVSDAGNIDLLVFDEIIQVRKVDLVNWAATVSGVGGAGPSGNVAAPALAGFPPASVFVAGRSPRQEWQAAQVAAGKRTN